MDSIVIDRALRAIVMPDGLLVPLIDLFDINGDETQDPSAAIAAVAELPNGTWMSLIIDDFPQLVKH